MDNPGKILVIQLKRAGDVVLTTPIPALLKKRWPLVHVDFLAEKAFAPLLENNPAIDGIQIYDKEHIGTTLNRIRAERYDAVLDFQSSPRSAIVSSRPLDLITKRSAPRITALLQLSRMGRNSSSDNRRASEEIT